MTNLVQQTLTEQQQITESEIEHRKKLFGITTEQEKILIDFRLVVKDKINAITEEFYAKQIEDSDISLLIGDADTLNRLKQAQVNYISSIFSGSYSLDYVNNRLRIGLVHKRIGVPPKLYLSAMETLKAIIYAHIKGACKSAEQFEALRIAIERILLFDISYVFDTYIKYLVEEISVSKQKIEEYAQSLEDKIAEKTLRLKENSYKDES